MSGKGRHRFRRQARVDPARDREVPERVAREDFEQLIPAHIQPTPLKLQQTAVRISV
jgi:hypothetical protein